jgi:hypothetical protein
MNFYKHFHVYCLIWAEFGIRDMYVMLLSVSQVHENWQRDRHAFITSINKMTKQNHTFQTGCSHSSVAQNPSPMGCYAMSPGQEIPRFQGTYSLHLDG